MNFMRTTCTILVAVLSAVSTALAQTPIPPKPVLDGVPVLPRPLITESDNSSLVSQRAFANTLATRFSYLITGDREFSTLGNFASVDVVKPTATVAFGGILHYRDSTRIHVLSGSFTGTGDKDVTALFSNDELNSAFEGRINYSIFLGGGTTKFFYEPGEKERLKALREAATSAARYERSKYFTQKSKLDSSRTALVLIANDLTKQPQRIDPYSSTEKPKKYREVEAYDKAFSDFRAAHVKLMKDSARYHSSANFNKTFVDTVFYVDKSARWSSVRLSWLDVFGSLKQQNVQLYNDKSPFFGNKLTEDKAFYNRVGLAANFSYSSDKYWRIFNGILRFEMSFAKSNNMNELSTFEVATAQKFDSANVTRTAAKKVNAYNKNDFKVSYYTDFRIDLLKQLTKNRRTYLRAVYNYSVPRNQRRAETDLVPSTHDLTLGLLLAFNKKGETKPGEARSIVNFQPYIKLRDFTNEYQKDLSALRRSEIGILTTFPFGLSAPTTKSE